MNKTGKIVVIALLGVALLAGGIILGMNWNNWFNPSAGADLDENAVDWQGEKASDTGKNTDTIDIPGYGSLTLKADTAEQSVNFNNPQANICYFRLTLLLSDGTQLWQSKLIAPGKGLYNITLEQTLSPGTYEDARLKYECFAMDKDQTPMNGSEIKLTLNVVE